MPRHMLPQVGTLVWYWSAPGKRPTAAIVVKRVSQVSFNLATWVGDTGVATPQLAVPFLENPGLVPASGAYCTPTGIQDTIDGASAGVQLADAEEAPRGNPHPEPPAEHQSPHHPESAGHKGKRRAA